MPKQALEYLNDRDPWMLGEDIPDTDLFFCQIWLSCFTNEFKYPAGRAYKKVMTVFKGYHLWFYFGEQDSKEEGDHIVNKFVKDPEFTKKLNKQIIVEADKLRNFSNKLPEENLDKLTNKQLWEYYKKHDEVHTHYYKWCWVPVGADMFHDNLTEKLKAYLRTIGVPEDEINEELVVLTTPVKKSLIQIEREQFQRLAVKVQKDSYHCKLFTNLFKTFKEQDVAKFGLNTHSRDYEDYLEKKVAGIKAQIKPWVLKAIEKHYLEYYYVKFLWIGKDGLYTFDYYLKELVRLIGSDAHVEKTYQKEQAEFKNILQQRAALIKKRKITGKWKTIFDSWGDFMVTKIYRRYAQIYAIYRMQPILNEIAKRLKISLMQARFMLTSEVGEALTGKKKVNKKELASRTRFCVHFTEKGGETVLTGKQARDLAKKAETAEHEEVSELSGQCGCVGQGQGEVKIIIRSSDMDKMKKGDVLVSIATDPDIVPAMKKASAIVTEQGGVTSHAAIVSRELNIPCVIGTKIATKVLKDGDLVEVDATKGVVKKM